MKIFLQSLALIAAIILLANCKRADKSMQFDPLSIKAMSNSYNMAILSALHGRSCPAQFNSLFPHAVNGISYYTGEAGQPKWYSKAGLYGRYVLRMYCDIKLDNARTNIVWTGPPSFDMAELTNIVLNPGGSASMQTHPAAKISLDTWQRLVDAKGDFGALGILLVTNKPIEHFEAVWQKF